MGGNEEKISFLQSFDAYDQIWTSISPDKFAKNELTRGYDFASVSLGFYPLAHVFGSLKK